MRDTAVGSRQRALLERLAALGDQQVDALDAGDIALLTHLSEVRREEVSAAAAFVPPSTAWEPGLDESVARVRERAELLQQAIRACMVAVRRDLAALTHHQQATRYLSGALPPAHTGGGAGEADRAGGTWTA